MSKNVLEKIINNWIEYYFPEWWGGSSDLDIGAVNALIDMKLWDYDSLFSVTNWLYQILNSIDTEDEIWLSSWDTRAEIVADDTSMSLISHCYAVMCYIANSTVAMSTILADASATDEISECWNSISIISESQLASDLYLASVNWITSLFTYQTAQDAFFTSTARKTQIVNQNLMVIVNDDTLLAQLNTDSVVQACIVNSTTALSTIAWDNDKLEIVKENTAIMNAIAVNSTALAAMSDSDFFEYILEDSTYLTTCAWSTNWKAKINSYAADDLLDPIYFWTWDLGYNTFAALAADDTSMEIVQANSNAMKIVNSNDEAKSYTIKRYESNSNTKVYIPMTTDLLDHWPNSRTVTNSNSVSLVDYSWTLFKVASFKTWAKYLSFPNIDNMSWAWTVSVRANIDSWKKEWEWLFTQWTWSTNRGLHLWYSTWTRGLTFAMYWNDADTSSYERQDWIRHNYTFTWDWSTWYCIYVDWVLKKSWTLTSGFYSWNNTWYIGTWFTDQSTRKFDWYMSEFFIESWVWNASKVSEFYNKTKKNYWK